MMICNADFEELFPDIFPPQITAMKADRQSVPAAASMARWENEGGRAKPAPKQPEAAQRLYDALNSAERERVATRMSPAASWSKLPTPESSVRIPG